MGVMAMLKRLGTKHYVPILRWKEAERVALSQLADGDSALLIPLIELVPDNFVQADKKGHITKLGNSNVTNKIAGQLFQSWGERPLFVDLGNLPGETLTQGSSHPLVMLGQYASILKLSLIPVIGIHRDNECKIAVRTVLSMF